MIIGGYVVVWGSPTDLDLENEYFTPDTDLGQLRNYPVIYYESHLNQFEKIGQTTRVEKDDVGLWVEAHLDFNIEKGRAVGELIHRMHNDGKTNMAMVVKGNSVDDIKETEISENVYRIDVYPVDEIAITPTPADPKNKITKIEEEDSDKRNEHDGFYLED